MEKYERIASAVFEKHGLGFDAAERAGGWTNGVWINGGLVLRLSMEKGCDRLRREAEHAKYLPAIAGYPAVVAAGVADGYEWSLSERIKGKALSEVWDGLGWPEKAAAVKQTLGIARGVHSVDVGKAEHVTSRRAWYSAFVKDESLADVERYVSRKVLTAGQGRAMREILERFYEWRRGAEPVLNHGDITADNLLWRDGNIVALLDFEHAVIAPRQLDVQSLVNLTFLPYDEAASSDAVLFAEDDPDTRRYVNELIPLFAPFCRSQCEKDLLLGYAVLFRQRFLDMWLEAPGGRLNECDAYHKLVSLIDGNGGYLSNLFIG